jgi:hypothetical protein
MRLLTTNDLTELCSRYNIHINGIFCRDEIPKTLHEGWYILNLDRKTGTGTHWTTWYYANSGNPSMYFDSFGFPPTQVLSTRISPFKYNSKKIQNLNSDSCGWFSLMTIHYCEHRGNDLGAFNQLLSLFCDEPQRNEKILENYFSNI